MVNIIFRHNGKDTVVQANAGETLLEAANNAGVELFGGCGGAGVCGSCRVNIDSSYINKLEEPSFEEQDLLDAIANGNKNTRLACQVTISDALDGMIVEIP
ncbi:MAG: 2Fe-2S iron-sulfur cluster binding domain-containing protein [Alphaproteobacteria bacterium]|nr:2Fe-2S iron-sulfur cluster binding domain-containing protein [Alphaproteobacteria bacterium]